MPKIEIIDLCGILIPGLLEDKLSALHHLLKAQSFLSMTFIYLFMFVKL